MQSSENMIISCEVDVESLKMSSIYFRGEKTVGTRIKKVVTQPRSEFKTFRMPLNVATRIKKGGNSAEIRIQDIPNAAKSVSSAMKKHSSILQLMVVSIFGTSETVY